MVPPCIYKVSFGGLNTIQMLKFKVKCKSDEIYLRYEWRLTVTSPFQPVGVAEAEGIHDHREGYGVITVGPLHNYGLVSLSWCCSSLGSLITNDEASHCERWYSRCYHRRYQLATHTMLLLLLPGKLPEGAVLRQTPVYSAWARRLGVNIVAHN